MNLWYYKLGSPVLRRGLVTIGWNFTLIRCRLSWMLRTGLRPVLLLLLWLLLLLRLVMRPVLLLLRLLVLCLLMLRLLQLL